MLGFKHEQELECDCLGQVASVQPLYQQRYTKPSMEKGHEDELRTSSDRHRKPALRTTPGFEDCRSLTILRHLSRSTHPPIHHPQMFLHQNLRRWTRRHLIPGHRLHHLPRHLPRPRPRPNHLDLNLSIAAAHHRPAPRYIAHQGFHASRRSCKRTRDTHRSTHNGDRRGKDIDCRMRSAGNHRTRKMARNSPPRSRIRHNLNSRWIDSNRRLSTSTDRRSDSLARSMSNRNRHSRIEHTRHTGV